MARLAAGLLRLSSSWVPPATPGEQPAAQAGPLTWMPSRCRAMVGRGFRLRPPDPGRPPAAEAGGEWSPRTALEPARPLSLPRARRPRPQPWRLETRRNRTLLSLDAGARGALRPGWAWVPAGPLRLDWLQAAGKTDRDPGPKLGPDSSPPPGLSPSALPPALSALPCPSRSCRESSRCARRFQPLQHRLPGAVRPCPCPLLTWRPAPGNPYLAL